MINLLFQSYGSKQIADEVIYSVLTFISTVSNIEQYRIVIYTDNKSIFEKYLSKLNVSYRIIAKDELIKWKGANDFIHRAKIEIILDCFEKYDGDILYCDSDTIFTGDIQELSSFISLNSGLMHVNEGFINRNINPIFKKISKFLQNNTFSLREENIKIPVNTPMWNAGVLGIHRENLHLVKSVLLLCDDMFSKYQKHVIEQLAFSYVLNRNISVKKASTHIYHYWEYKPLYREAIDRFLYDKDENIVSAVLNKEIELNIRFSEKPKKRKLFSSLLLKR